MIWKIIGIFLIFFGAIGVFDSLASPANIPAAAVAGIIVLAGFRIYGWGEQKRNK